MEGSQFGFGVFIGFVSCAIVILYSLSDNPQEIHTKKKLTPEWKLVTDGKVVDTMYIYKEK